MNIRRKVWMHRSRAIVWTIVGVLSFPLGWANSVVLVWIASLYANVSTDLGAAEAADDRKLIALMEGVNERLDMLTLAYDRLHQMLEEQGRLGVPPGPPEKERAAVVLQAVRPGVCAGLPEANQAGDKVARGQPRPVDVDAAEVEPRNPLRNDA